MGGVKGAPGALEAARHAKAASPEARARGRRRVQKLREGGKTAESDDWRVEPPRADGPIGLRKVRALREKVGTRRAPGTKAAIVFPVGLARPEVERPSDWSMAVVRAQTG